MTVDVVKLIFSTLILAGLYCPSEICCLLIAIHLRDDPYGSDTPLMWAFRIIVLSIPVILLYRIARNWRCYRPDRLLIVSRWANVGLFIVLFLSTILAFLGFQILKLGSVTSWSAVAVLGSPVALAITLGIMLRNYWGWR
jgi:hypothetical protein